jgi:hypothetical protein
MRRYRTDYQFCGPNGIYQHRAAEDFRNSAHAREWAHRAGLSFMGPVSYPEPSRDEPGSAAWCETNSDNR